MDLGPVSPFQATDRSMAGALVRPRSGGAALSRRALLSAALITALLAVALASLARGPSAEGPSPVRSFGHAQALSHAAVTGLPLAAQAQISGALAAAMPAFRAIRSGEGFQTANATQGLTATFEGSGVAIAGGSVNLHMRLRSIGAGGSSLALGASAPTASANLVSYTRPELSEWYRNGPQGVEQGFTIPRSPAGAESAPLTLTMSLSGNASQTLSRDAQSIVLRRGATSLSYGALVATDASGRTLHSWLGLEDGKILLRVDASGARYPLTIDPLLQKGGKLSGGEAEARFGASAALSADGSTLVIGAPQAKASQGAVWVFARSGATWTQQGEALTAPESVSESPVEECAEEATDEEGECAFGSSVALSADGNTALVGDPSAGDTRGAAWVLTRSEGVWTRGPALAGGGEAGEGRFGRSVSLSSDGNTALVGVPSAAYARGGAWVFTRSGPTWTRELMLVDAEASRLAYFGRSVALSGDGQTALIGAPGYASYEGAAWRFTRSGSTWTQQHRLSPGGESVEGHFGKSVALSTDGSTALIGAQGDGAGHGAVWTFGRAGAESEFAQQGKKLVGAVEGGEPHFGASVALSGDGATALVGAPRAEAGLGLVSVFTRTGSGWSEKPALGGSEAVGKGWSGASVALSSDGEVAAIGAPRDQKKAGGAWVFSTEPVSATHPPSVANVAPGRGPTQGGTEVTITGSNFTSNEQHEPVVMFGSKPAASIKVRTAAEIRAVSPPSPAGRVDVTVTTETGTSAISPADGFRFEGGGPSGPPPPSPPPPPPPPTTTTTAETGRAASAAGGVLGIAQTAGAGCRVSLRSKRVVVGLRTGAAIRLLRTGAGECRGTVTLRYKQKVRGKRFKLRTIGSARFSIAPGRSQVVKIKLNKLGRKLFLAGHGKLNASLAVVRTSPAPKLAKTASVRLSVKKTRRPATVAH
jgi:hypothetical protein